MSPRALDDLFAHLRSKLEATQGRSIPSLTPKETDLVIAFLRQRIDACACCDKKRLNRRSTVFGHIGTLGTVVMSLVCERCCARRTPDEISGIIAASLNRETLRNAATEGGMQ